MRRLLALTALGLGALVAAPDTASAHGLEISFSVGDLFASHHHDHNCRHDGDYWSRERAWRAEARARAAEAAAREADYRARRAHRHHHATPAVYVPRTRHAVYAPRGRDAYVPRGYSAYVPRGRDTYVPRGNDAYVPRGKARPQAAQTPRRGHGRR